MPSSERPESSTLVMIAGASLNRVKSITSSLLGDFIQGGLPSPFVKVAGRGESCRRERKVTLLKDSKPFPLVFVTF